jgi:hypothetical protein
MLVHSHWAIQLRSIQIWSRHEFHLPTKRVSTYAQSFTEFIKFDAAAFVMWLRPIHTCIWRNVYIWNVQIMHTVCTFKNTLFICWSALRNFWILGFSMCTYIHLFPLNSFLWVRLSDQLALIGHTAKPKSYDRELQHHRCKKLQHHEYIAQCVLK